MVDPCCCNVSTLFTKKIEHFFRDLWRFDSDGTLLNAWTPREFFPYDELSVSDPDWKKGPVDGMDIRNDVVIVWGAVRWNSSKVADRWGVKLYNPDGSYIGTITSDCRTRITWVILQESGDWCVCHSPQNYDGSPWTTPNTQYHSTLFDSSYSLTARSQFQRDSDPKSRLKAYVSDGDGIWWPGVSSSFRYNVATIESTEATSLLELVDTHLVGGIPMICDGSTVSGQWNDTFPSPDEHGIARWPNVKNRQRIEAESGLTVFFSVAEDPETDIITWWLPCYDYSVGGITGPDLGLRIMVDSVLHFASYNPWNQWAPFGGTGAGRVYRTGNWAAHSSLFSSLVEPIFGSTKFVAAIGAGGAEDFYALDYTGDEPEWVRSYMTAQDWSYLPIQIRSFWEDNAGYVGGLALWYVDNGTGSVYEKVELV